MSVRIRMKKMGRTHRPFFRICAFDKRAPRDGRAIEELGTYDPSIPDADARAVLKRDRIDYWLSVGAQPSEKVAVLIKKYGTDGTHAAQQQAALERLSLAPEVADPEGDAAGPTPEPPTPEPETPPAAEGDAATEGAAPEAAASDAPAAAEESAAEESKPEAADSGAKEAGAEEKAEEKPAEQASEETPAEA